MKANRGDWLSVCFVVLYQSVTSNVPDLYGVVRKARRYRIPFRVKPAIVSVFKSIQVIVTKNHWDREREKKKRIRACRKAYFRIRSHRQRLQLFFWAAQIVGLSKSGHLRISNWSEHSESDFF